ncbi:MAG: SBBP repeat-containing protein [Verrucomicrobiota bacterium]
MKKIAHPLLAALVCGLGATTLPAVQKTPVPEATRRALSEAPLCFEANHGQAGATASFIARGQDSTVLLSPTEASLVVMKEAKTQTVRLTLNGANASAKVQGIDELPGFANYFIGADASQWRAKVPLFSRVRIDNAYPGIDVVYYADQQARLEYDFLLQPGADFRQIKLGISGADLVELDADGNLVLKIGVEEVRQHKPVIYQTVDGSRKVIAGGYRLSDKQTVTFWIGDYDHSLPLVIDPTLAFSSYLAGKGGDSGWDIATDASGNVYVCGETLTAFIATGGAAQPLYGGTQGTKVSGDAFVAKFVPNGTNADLLELSYLTYLGGSGQDAARSIAADADGNAYVTGFTDSPNFPTRNAAYKRISGINNNPLKIYRSDAFVTKIRPDGSGLAFSTYLGGSERDCGNAIALDSATNVYVAGFTESFTFPIVIDRADGAKRVVQSSFGGSLTSASRDAFVTKFGPNGTNVIFSSFLGGASLDSAQGVAVDAGQNVYLTGYTISTDFPTVGKKTLLNGLGSSTSTYDAFFTKISANGATNLFSAYLGGFNTDVGLRIAVQPGTANAFLTGYTFSTNFPVTTKITNTRSWGGAAADVFVAKYSPTNILNGTNLVPSYFKEYAIAFGSKGADQAYGIAVNALGEACVAGVTSSTNFFGTNSFAFLRSTNKIGSATGKAFVVRLNDNATAFTSATLLGGKGNDTAHGVALDAAGKVYIVGGTTSVDFPTTNGKSRPGGKTGKSVVFISTISP